MGNSIVIGLVELHSQIVSRAYFGFIKPIILIFMVIKGGLKNRTISIERFGMTTAFILLWFIFNLKRIYS